MSVDLTDPNISRTYDEIIKNKGVDWLLLTYGKTRDKLTLLSSGIGTFDNLCDAVSREPEDIYFGFCREREGESNYFAIIAFVPEGISGVRRARALVHSRAVGSLFKAANISMNVSNLESQNVNKLRERLQLGPTSIPRLSSEFGKAAGVQRSVSMPVEIGPSPIRGSPAPARRQILPTNPRSTSESIVQPDSPQFPSIPSEYVEDNHDAPPTPPKDPRGNLGHGRTTIVSRSVSATPDMARSRITTFFGDKADKVVIQPGRSSSSGICPSTTRRVVSPEAKARERIEAQKKRAEEEARLLREEEQRQLRLRRQKEEMLRQAEKEEELRRFKLEEEKRHALAERARKEREAQMEEEHRQQEIETRRRQERERRLLRAKRLEEERLENERRAAEAAERREEQRRASDRVKQQRMSEIQSRYASFGFGKTSAVIHSGNVSVQTSGSISWKRRYFELSGTSFSFYRDSQDRSAPLDILMLNDGRVSGIREPHEGHEELEAIPHAFAVEFNDGEDAWAIFCDNNEDKDVLMSLLSKVAGL